MIIINRYVLLIGLFMLNFIIYAQAQETNAPTKAIEYPSISSDTFKKLFYDMMWIESGKEMWRIQSTKTNGVPAETNNIIQYMPGSRMPTPPILGKYEINPIGQAPEFRITIDDLRKYLNDEKKKATNMPPRAAGYSMNRGGSSQP